MAAKKKQSKSAARKTPAPKHTACEDSLPLSMMSGGLPEHHAQGLGFVMANRRARRSSDDRKRSRESVDTNFSELLSAHVDLRAEHEVQGDEGRKIVHFDGELREVLAKLPELSPDVVIEAKLPRFPAISIPEEVRVLQAMHGVSTISAGDGDRLRLELRSAGNPVAAAEVTLYLVNNQQRATSLVARSDDAGRVEFEFSAGMFRPAACMIEPDGGAWAKVHPNPQSGDVVELAPLVLEGPVGWWNLLTGAGDYDLDLGSGMKIGVVDTGAGPHPFLKHVRGLGSALNGSFRAGAAATEDFKNHGSHVCGIIGARPDAESSGFGGIAPGAELSCIRVFDGPTANQGDIAAAIDRMAFDQQVDLVNLSLGGPPSALEADAIQAAWEAGTLCVCAVGNDNGGPVLSPASLPYTAAVAAVGMPNAFPANSLSAANQPHQADKIASSGLFVCSFSN